LPPLRPYMWNLEHLAYSGTKMAHQAPVSHSTQELVLMHSSTRLRSKRPHDLGKPSLNFTPRLIQDVHPMNVPRFLATVLRLFQHLSGLAPVGLLGHY